VSYTKGYIMILKVKICKFSNS